MTLRKVSVGRDQGRQDQLLRLQMLAPDILTVHSLSLEDPYVLALQ